jgi:hypothetical protein
MRKTGLLAIRALLGEVPMNELREFWSQLSAEEKKAFAHQAEADPRVNPPEEPAE